MAATPAQIESGSDVAAMAQDAGDEFSRALLKARFPGTEEEDRKEEKEEAAREAGSGVANPVAAATPALLESGSDMAAGSGVANPIAAVLDMVDRGMNITFHSRVSAAWSSASQRRYDRFVQYAALDKDVRAQLTAIRRGHLIEYFSQYDKCTLMQLGIGWWREVRVCPALFYASDRRAMPRYLEIITSDRLYAMMQVTPLTIANHNEATRVVANVAPSSYVGYVVIDGQLYHES